MARKNPDKAKEAFKRLSAEILKYGDEGKQDLKELFDVHKPEVIFKLEPGPERQARAAQLIGDMRVLSRELAQAKYFRERGGKKGKPARKERKAHREVPGTYDRFKYVLVELDDGKWGAKITRQGRQIIPEPGAPPIVDHPRLKKSFDSQSDAEIGIRRIINTAMIWYADRGIVPKEKVRRTAGVRETIHRRTAGQVAARERAQLEREAEEEKEAKRERRAARRREEKVEGRKPRRPSEPSTSRGRKMVFIPRKNPGNPFTFERIGEKALAQGEKSLSRYREWQEKWEDSLREEKPNFSAVMKAYDNIENARANFVLAGESHLADKAEEIKKSLRHNIIEVFKYCRKELKSRGGVRQNPSASEHDELGAKNMLKADECWKKYCDTGNVVCLMDAYKYLVLSKEEFDHAGNSEGEDEAKERIKLVRSELRKMIKG